MATQMVIFLISGFIILVLLIINAVLFWHALKTNKKIDKLLEKGKIKSFKEIFLAQREKNEGLEEEIKKIISRVKNLEDISQITIKKIGIVRFNPYNDMGGNQSFVIALLNNKNNGFLISSLFGQDGNRVYAKTIKQGKQDYLLSNEEQEALNRAINQKNV